MNQRHPILTLARKELSMLFNSPATYVIFVTFLLVTGYLFVAPLFDVNLSVLDSFTKPLPLLLTFVMPALTMRTFSEEFRAGTIEYLSTLPLRDSDVVLAKFLAVMGLTGSLLAFTLVYPALLLMVGRPDLGQMIGSYLSLLGAACFFGAIGLWASSMTRNQVVAFILGFFVCFFFFLLSRVADLMPGALENFVRSWGVEAHFEALSRGVLDTRDLLYWASGTAFFLAACLMSLHSRKWRGT
jgi:ABC-2 type transport system permease protein